MLGKLIKYDIKSLNRFLIIIHAFLLLSALLIRFFFTERISISDFTGSETDSTLLLMTGLIFVLYTLIITCVSFATGLIITVRFYKNLFSDEGYLSQTLPVTRGQHLLSKTISGSIWGCIDVFLVFASMYIVAATPEITGFIREHLPEIREELGLTGSYGGITLQTLVIILILFGFMGSISNIITYYASVVLGQLFSGHRVFGAVAAYFAITGVLSILLFFFVAILGLSPLFTYSAITAPPPAEYFKQALLFSTLFTIITSILLYIIAYWVMNKKLDLA